MRRWWKPQREKHKYQVKKKEMKRWPRGFFSFFSCECGNHKIFYMFIYNNNMAMYYYCYIQMSPLVNVTTMLSANLPVFVVEFVVNAAVAATMVDVEKYRKSIRAIRMFVHSSITCLNIEHWIHKNIYTHTHMTVRNAYIPYIAIYFIYLQIYKIISIFMRNLESNQTIKCVYISSYIFVQYARTLHFFSLFHWLFSY